MCRPETRYIANVRDLVRKNLRFFLIVSAAAVLLRLIFIFRFPGVVTDSFVYGDIAKNWLQHGIYGLSGPDEISPTYIRLPGYPAFLAFIFALFGMEHYRAVLSVQMFVDLGTCFLCADIALRLLGPKFGKIAFVLACLCPFLADYSAAALTETLEIFFTTLAFDLAIRGLQRDSMRNWAGCGAACAAAILLRPDGALLVMTIDLYLLAQILKPNRHNGLTRQPRRLRLNFQAATLVTVIAVAPLVPWTIRNYKVMGKFQPLAPRYANEEDEFVPMGFNRWVKTWIVDYASTEEIYWAVPGSEMDSAKLPSRAFDSPRQQTETAVLFNDYNQELHISSDLDKRFQALATQRIYSHPLRYYVSLPLLRILDMWLRPRTEMLPCDTRWWEFNDDVQWAVLAVALGAINLAYFVYALAGWIYARRLPLVVLLALFAILRSAFLGTLENPEPRYTLEMYPVVIVLAAFALGKMCSDQKAGGG
jgi:4-amino-4-deoxy-L-arabinose transferase-like glycosyltransferase